MNLHMRGPASPSLPGEKPLRFSLSGMLLGVTLAAIAIGVITWLMRQSDMAHRANEVRNAMQMAYTGVQSFEDVYKTYPTAIFATRDGKPLGSWRFRIVPFMGWNQGVNFKESWDSPANQHVRTGWAAGYLCTPSSVNPCNTIVFGIAGPSTAFDQTSPAKYDDIPTDLALFMEVADSKTHWMQPGDYDVAKLLAATGRLGDNVKGLLKDRIHILFADGQVWALSPDTPIDALKPFLTITAAKAADRDRDLGPYRVDD